MDKHGYSKAFAKKALKSFDTGIVKSWEKYPSKSEGQHLITNPECAKTYTDDNFRTIGQARSSFRLSVLEYVYIKTQNPVLCRQKGLVFSLGLFK